MATNRKDEGMLTKTWVIRLGGATFALALAGPAVNHASQFNASLPDESAYPIRIALPPPILEVGSGVPSILIPPTEPFGLVEADGPAETAAAAPFARVSPRSQSNENPGGGQGLLADIKFDLARVSRPAEYSRDRASLEVRKPVNLDGANQGEARIYILSDSLLAINRDELNRLLVTAGKANLDHRGTPGGEAAEEIITFDDLRELGIGIHYDPNGDRIIVST
jgi:hypothetical protein